VLARLGARRAFVVHGAHGVDELSPAGPNLVYEVEDGRVRAEPIDPLDLGIERCDPSDLRGGSPEQNARAIREIFAGRRGGARDAVVLNAAGAIAAAGRTRTLREALPVAGEAIDSGSAGELLDRLIAFTRAEVPV
jgi:anthranilate phosphoribosyltransferase